MRRSSPHKKNLRFIFLILGIIIYLPLSDMSYYMPPLLGVLYVLSQDAYERANYNAFYILVPLLLIFETTKNLPLGSTLLFLAFSFAILLPKVRKFLGFSKILIPFFIAYSYFGYFLFLKLFGIILDEEFLKFNWIFAWYVLCEIFLIWIFLWIL
ncbi:hypothetical protein [Helicobacter burdigaliensis]|uniref:hypothetical protein n=1 Tax=Helicobacter burdigaliensis TaxID=2315334 RepID=UPI000EF72C75|nr:hypothetical protein [Helicobacter burdigaliensis]